MVVKLVREGAAWVFDNVARVGREHLNLLPEEPRK